MARMQNKKEPYQLFRAKASQGGGKIRLWAVAFWLLVWQAASMLIGQSLILVSPVRVVLRLGELMGKTSFWSAIGFTLVRIVIGFAAAMVLGVLLAALAAHFRRVGELLSPLMLTLRATPVASFVILAIIMVGSRNLAALMSFIMVLPIIYANVREGITATSTRLLEMAKVFRLPLGRVLRYIYVPQVLPFFRTACVTSLGISWKSGVAAEVIGIPTGSMGEQLYNAKMFFATPDVFAWTLVIILVSLAFEKLFLLLLDSLVRHMERT